MDLAGLNGSPLERTILLQEVVKSFGCGFNYICHYTFILAPRRVYFNVIPTSEAAAGFSYVADCNAIYIHYKTPPQAKQTLSWNWMLKKDAIPKTNL